MALRPLPRDASLSSPLCCNAKSIRTSITQKCHPQLILGHEPAVYESADECKKSSVAYNQEARTNGSTAVLQSLSSARLMFAAFHAAASWCLEGGDDMAQGSSALQTALGLCCSVDVAPLRNVLLKTEQDSAPHKRAPDYSTCFNGIFVASNPTCAIAGEVIASAHVISIDAEWKPYGYSPVAILQIAVGPAVTRANKGKLDQLQLIMSSFEPSHVHPGPQGSSFVFTGHEGKLNPSLGIVFVFDLQVLSATAVRRALLPSFIGRLPIKTGVAIDNDLQLLSRTRPSILPPQTVCKSVVDLTALWNAVYASALPDVPLAACLGRLPCGHHVKKPRAKKGTKKEFEANLDEGQEEEEELQEVQGSAPSDAPSAAGSTAPQPQAARTRSKVSRVLCPSCSRWRCSGAHSFVLPIAGIVYCPAVPVSATFKPSTDPQSLNIQAMLERPLPALRVPKKEEKVEGIEGQTMLYAEAKANTGAAAAAAGRKSFQKPQRPDPQLGNTHLEWLSYETQPNPRGLAAFVNACVGYPLPKEQRMTDWSRRPLSKDQLMYAACDAFAGILARSAIISAAGALCKHWMQCPAAHSVYCPNTERYVTALLQKWGVAPTPQRKRLRSASSIVTRSHAIDVDAFAPDVDVSSWTSETIEGVVSPTVSPQWFPADTGFSKYPTFSRLGFRACHALDFAAAVDVTCEVRQRKAEGTDANLSSAAADGAQVNLRGGRGRGRLGRGGLRNIEITPSTTTVLRSGPKRVLKSQPQLRIPSNAPLPGGLNSENIRR